MSISPETALRLLRDGNARFAAGAGRSGYTAAERSRAIEGQRPVAVIVGCSDSRVPVEAVFDAGVGELFVVRNAGHVLAAAGRASVRFAVEVLGARLVVVLGHEDCGAVAAALSGNATEWLSPIVGKIDLSGVRAEDAPADAEDALLAAAVDAHVRESVTELQTWLRDDLGDGAPLVIGGAYKLATGIVHWLD